MKKLIDADELHYLRWCFQKVVNAETLMQAVTPREVLNATYEQATGRAVPGDYQVA